jgi:hypothetical protein
MRRVAVGLGLALATVGVGGTVASAAQVPPGLAKSERAFHGTWDCPGGPVDVISPGGAIGFNAATGEQFILTATSVIVKGEVVESVTYPGQGPKGPRITCTQGFDSDGDMVNDSVFTITVVQVPGR